MKTRIYLAGGSTERLTVVRPFMNRVRASPTLELTWDWTVCEGYERPFTPAEKKAQARRDLEGILKADVVWFLWPAALSEGASVELGFSLGLQLSTTQGRQRTLVASGPAAERCIFAGLPQLTFPEHEQAFEYASSLRGRDALEPS